MNLTPAAKKAFPFKFFDLPYKKLILTFISITVLGALVLNLCMTGFFTFRIIQGPPAPAVTGKIVDAAQKKEGGFAGGEERMSPNQSVFEILILSPDDIKTRFKDVAGNKEIKEDLEELMDFMKNPEKFRNFGAKLPKGVLFYGPPGTGKTLVARALAGEANVTFLAVSGSDFEDGWMGTGSARVKQLFAEARNRAPCIIFIDEIDALAMKRTGSADSGSHESRATVNQLLSEMDGLLNEGDDGVLVIGATNDQNILDPAILRPGRFDRQLVFSMPTLEERKAILKTHSEKKPLAPEVDLDRLAKMSSGTSGADLANWMNEAAIFAAKNGHKDISSVAIDYALDRIRFGKKRSAVIMSDEEKKLVAYHESGHALINYLLLSEWEPLDKITIIPHANALGVTASVSEKDFYLYNRQYFNGKIATSLGGRVAEEFIFGADKVTNGAENDFEKATEVAAMMVRKWGLSKLGPMTMNEGGAREDLIDEEVRNIIEHNLAETKRLISENKDTLDALAEALLAKETLLPQDIQKIMDEHKPVRKKR